MLRGIGYGLVVTCAVGVAQGKVFMSVDEALELAFPRCEVKRESVYLSDAERKRVATLAGAKAFEQGIVFPYVARKNGVIVGTAYFDAHRVRSMRQTLMVVVSPQAVVERIDVLAFAEPTEYIPNKAWYKQFALKPLDDRLRLKRDIAGVTGATLTARATTRCARRVLALHTTIAERVAVTSKPVRPNASKPTSRPASRPTSRPEAGERPKS